MMQTISDKIKQHIKRLNAHPDAYSILRAKLPVKDGPESRIWIHILLFILTLISTTAAGAYAFDSFQSFVLSGIPYSLTIMGILLSHEMGHYLTARYFNIKASLPYFIPFPSINGFPSFIGTFGAIIKMRSPIPGKRALLYIGALGPIAGFITSLAASIAGIYLSSVQPIPTEAGTYALKLGDSLLFGLLVRIIHGPIPEGFDLYLSPYALAGWVGFLITSLNLMPMGQLDGSHVIYSLIGKKQIIFGWATLACLAMMSFVFPGWAVWIIIALLFLMIGHPRIEDNSVLSAREKAIGWSCFMIFILTFMPVPVDLYIPK